MIESIVVYMKLGERFLRSVTKNNLAQYWNDHTLEIDFLCTISLMKCYGALQGVRNVKEKREKPCERKVCKDSVRYLSLWFSQTGEILQRVRVSCLNSKEEHWRLRSWDPITSWLLQRSLLCKTLLGTWYAVYLYQLLEISWRKVIV